VTCRSRVSRTLANAKHGRDDGRDKEAELRPASGSVHRGEAESVTVPGNSPVLDRADRTGFALRTRPGKPIFRLLLNDLTRCQAGRMRVSRRPGGDVTTRPEGASAQSQCALERPSCRCANLIGLEQGSVAPARSLRDQIDTYWIAILWEASDNPFDSRDVTWMWWMTVRTAVIR
jgi:hypothetical protein